MVSAASCDSSWDRSVEASVKASGVAMKHLRCTADQSSCIPMRRKAFEPHGVRPGDMVGNPQDYLLSVQLYVLELRLCGVLSTGSSMLCWLLRSCVLLNPLAKKLILACKECAEPERLNKARTTFSSSCTQYCLF